MSRSRDSLLIKLRLMDNIVTLQLVLMAPAFSASASRWALCALIMAVLFGAGLTACRILLRKTKNPPLRAVKLAASAVLAFVAAVFFMPLRSAVMCAAAVFIAERVLALVNMRIAASEINPRLRIISECVSACVLSMAMLALRL